MTKCTGSENLRHVIDEYWERFERKGKRGGMMTKILSLSVTVCVGFMFSGWALKTYCYIKYPNMPVTVGSVMLTKSKCFGRVTVNQCPEQEVMEIVYLGRTHSGEHIRIGSRVGSSTQFVAGVI